MDELYNYYLILSFHTIHIKFNVTNIILFIVTYCFSYPFSSHIFQHITIFFILTLYYLTY